jgi:hypothetical protein
MNNLSTGLDENKKLCLLEAHETNDVSRNFDGDVNDDSATMRLKK